MHAPDSPEGRNTGPNGQPISGLEELVARISVSFAGLTPVDIDATITNALARIGSFVGADRSYLFLYDYERGTLSNTHEWCAEGISAEKDNLQDIPIAAFQDFTEYFDRSNIREIPLVDDLPDEEAGLRETLQAQSIQSLVLVGMRNGDGVLTGFAGFDAVRSVRPWRPTDIHLLQVTCDLISGALENQRLWRRLAESEAYTRAILEALPDSLLVVSADGELEDMIVSREEPNPWLADELRETSLREFLGPKLVPLLDDLLNRVNAGETPAVQVFPLTRQGRDYHYEVRATRYRQDGFLGLVRDVSQRVEDERALRFLALELSEVEETQRRELALLLHDGIGQDLSAVHYQMQVCLQGEAPDRNRIALMSSMLQDAMRKTQDLTFDLSPPLLHELGLTAALQALARRVEREYGMACAVTAVGGDLPPGAERSVFLYRIARELVLNAVKHSGGDRIEIALDVDDDRVGLTVGDNGEGMETARVSAAGDGKAGGFGLFSIRQRLEPLGGVLNVESLGGAKVTVTLPRETPAEH